MGGHEWLSNGYNTGTIIVRAVYVDPFANRGRTMQFAKAPSERFHRKENDYFAISSLEAQDRVLDAASPARSSGDVPDAALKDDFVGAVLDFDDNLDTEGAIGVDEVGNGAVKRFLR